MTKRIQMHFHCVIELNEDDDIQWEHLPEELQAYFNSYSNSITVTNHDHIQREGGMTNTPKEPAIENAEMTNEERAELDGNYYFWLSELSYLSKLLDEDYDRLEKSIAIAASHDKKDYGSKEELRINNKLRPKVERWLNRLAYGEGV